jgi:hypothetical protein
VNRRHALGLLTGAVAFIAGADWPRLVAAGRYRSDEWDDWDDDERHGKCPTSASAGRTEAGRDCDGKTFARVDNDIDVADIRRHKDRDHPFERVQARGDGKIKATGDKGARRELRDKRRWTK